MGSTAEYMREYRLKYPEKVKASKARTYQGDLKRNRERHREDPVKMLLLWSRSSAKKRNLEHTIDLNDLVVPDVCPVFNTPFVVGTMQAMSIDRIDSTKGYVPGNVQIISRLANTMKQDATPEQLKLFAAWVEKGWFNRHG